MAVTVSMPCDRLAAMDVKSDALCLRWRTGHVHDAERARDAFEVPWAERARSA
jgi:hypothetical protein